MIKYCHPVFSMATPLVKRSLFPTNKHLQEKKTNKGVLHVITNSKKMALVKEQL